MSTPVLRRGLLAQVFLAGLSAAALAQQAENLRGFPSAEAAAEAFTDAVRRGDDKALSAMLGLGWQNFVQIRKDVLDPGREHYLREWDAKHSVTVSGENRAVVEVGKDRWTLPVSIVRREGEWKFDIASGYREMEARRLGFDEFGAIQTVLAIVDAQFEYVELDPMNTGWPQYARRLLSSPGKRDGLYWPTKPGEPPSPLGAGVAYSQSDGVAPGGHFGYNYRLLHAQGPDAPGGARKYLVDDHMVGGFAVIAWPAEYGVSGVMTFIASWKSGVYQQDLGPDTAQLAAAIVAFNPDRNWEKADETPP